MEDAQWNVPSYFKLENRFPMILIDKPYVSDFLIKTIIRNQFPVVKTLVASELLSNQDINWISIKDARVQIENRPDTTLYTNSENSLDWISQTLSKSPVANHISIFKDKLNFRKFVKTTFPDFIFEAISLDALQDLSLADLPIPCVIKPAVGFFSIGVHIVTNEADLKSMKSDLQAVNLKSVFPKSVLDTAHFIIEEFIPGDEFAVDYYCDAHGDVVILNLLHHKFASGNDTSDRLYTTSKALLSQYSAPISEFLQTVGQSLNLKNFPAHAEVKIDTNNTVVPIEINPLRFGGWCTSGDLLGVTLGFNAYDCLFSCQKPDWDKIYKGKEDTLLSLVVLNNNSGIPVSEIKGFDYEKFRMDFENVVEIRELDIRKFPVFGFAFLETSQNNTKELDHILNSDLTEYLL